jgi:putative methyltransferase
MSGRGRVYLNEYGLLQGGRGRTAFLPLVSGTLHAWALEHPDLRERYEFAPYLFHRDLPERILAAYARPAVAAFSMYIWNAQLCLTVARAVKRRWPECLVVFGGAHVPHEAAQFLGEHPFVDVAVRAEGEEPFVGVLRRFLDARTFEGVPGTTWRTPDGREVRTEANLPWDPDLDKYPSPYLRGLFDGLLRDHPDLDFQAILETNRGCPFRCTFCYWGKGGLNLKFKFHGLERLRAEIDWMARRRIRYILSADSNFGMHARDREIARFLIEAHRRHGFPERFRATYGKNTDERIFEVAAMLARAGLDKGVSLTHQSLSRTVQDNIKRWNISLETYERLQRRFNEAGIATHSDLIIGLPGETYASLQHGVQTLLERGAVHLNIYFLEVYPNTDMANPEYQRAFGVRTVRTELQENHCDVRRPGEVAESVDVVVATASMPVDDWRRTWCFAFVAMLFHSLKLGYFLMHYLRDRFGIRYAEFFAFVSEERASLGPGSLLGRELARYREALDAILAGAGIGAVEPEFGSVYWRVEEASFLRLSEELDRLYEELAQVLVELCRSRGVAFDPEELREVVRYQRLRMPSTTPLAEATHTFEYNVPEYCERLVAGAPIALRLEPQTLVVEAVDYGSDRVRFATERVLYARKNESTMNRVQWRPAAAAASR